MYTVQTTLDQEFSFLRSDFFKLILKHPRGLQQGEKTDLTQIPPPTGVYEANADECSFFVHKRLLASLSPELEKHVNNDMREGREGQMHLSEVEEETMIAFLCWAYTHDYKAYVWLNMSICKLRLI